MALEREREKKCGHFGGEIPFREISGPEFSGRESDKRQRLLQTDFKPKTQVKPDVDIEV